MGVSKVFTKHFWTEYFAERYQWPSGPLPDPSNPRYVISCVEGYYVRHLAILAPPERIVIGVAAGPHPLLVGWRERQRILKFYAEQGAPLTRQAAPVERPLRPEQRAAAEQRITTGRHQRQIHAIEEARAQQARRAEYQASVRIRGRQGIFDRLHVRQAPAFDEESALLPARVAGYGSISPTLQHANDSNWSLATTLMAGSDLSTLHHTSDSNWSLATTLVAGNDIDTLQRANDSWRGAAYLEEQLLTGAHILEQEFRDEAARLRERT